MSKNVNGLVALGVAISIVGAVMPTVAFADTMTPTQAADKIISVQASFDATNNTKESDILKYANAVTTGSGVTISVNEGSFQLNPASESSEGSVSVNLSLTNGTDADKNIVFTKEIAKTNSIEAEALKVADGKLQACLDAYKFTNSTTRTDLLNMIISAVNNNAITVTMDSFELTEATTTEHGKCYMDVTLSNADGDEAGGEYTYDFAKLGASSGEDANKAMDEANFTMLTYLKGSTYTNKTTAADIEKMLLSRGCFKTPYISILYSQI